MTNERPPFKIFTLKMARALRDQGFRILGTVPNSQKPWFNAYLFEATDEFMVAFKKLQKEWSDFNG